MLSNLEAQNLDAFGIILLCLSFVFVYNIQRKGDL